MIIPLDNVLQTKLRHCDTDMSTIKNWVLKKDIPRDHTFHHWQNALPSDEYKAFDRIATSKSMVDMFYKRFNMYTCKVEALRNMNEIYVSSSHHYYNSDTVFYMNHTDGPFYVFPFCYVYRCVVSLTENQVVETHFPMIPKSVCLSTGDVVAFDYNREIHYITDKKGLDNVEPFITLKCHYVVYPRIFKYGCGLGFLSRMYNNVTRYIFINTIVHYIMFWKIITWIVLFVTRCSFTVHYYIGWDNAVYMSIAHYLGALRMLILYAYCKFITFVTKSDYRRIAKGAFNRNLILYTVVGYLHKVIERT